MIKLMTKPMAKKGFGALCKNGFIVASLPPTCLLLLMVLLKGSFQPLGVLDRRFSFFIPLFIGYRFPKPNHSQSQIKKFVERRPSGVRES